MFPGGMPDKGGPPGLPLGNTRKTIMMTPDINLQVWLDTVAGTQPAMIVPYVQGPENSMLHYQLTATKQGVSGTSTIQQSGNVRLQANTPTALTRFSLSVGDQDKCTIKLILYAGSQAASHYQFDCPKAH
jgi:curli production protein